MKKILILAVLTIVTVGESLAQCAMCRSTVVNNVSNGDQLGLAAGLNNGILYLFVTPYILIGLIAFLWYKNASKNRAQALSKLAGKRI